MTELKANTGDPGATILALEKLEKERQSHHATYRGHAAKISERKKKVLAEAKASGLSKTAIKAVLSVRVSQAEANNAIAKIDDEDDRLEAAKYYHAVGGNQFRESQLNLPIEGGGPAQSDLEGISEEASVAAASTTEPTPEEIKAKTDAEQAEADDVLPKSGEGAGGSFQIPDASKAKRSKPRETKSGRTTAPKVTVQ